MKAFSTLQIKLQNNQREIATLTKVKSDLLNELFKVNQELRTAQKTIDELVLELRALKTKLTACQNELAKAQDAVTKQAKSRTKPKTDDTNSD